MTDRNDAIGDDSTALKPSDLGKMMRFRIAPHPVPALAGRHLHRWIEAAADRAAAISREHAQLVITVQSTDGLTREQAEFQVSSFERHFRDEQI